MSNPPKRPLRGPNRDAVANLPAIRELIQREYAAQIKPMMDVLIDLATGAESEETRRKAANDVLDKVGVNSRLFQEPSEQGKGGVTIQVTVQRQETLGSAVIEGQAVEVRAVPKRQE